MDFKRLNIGILGAALALLLSACAGLLQPREVVISEAKLQQMLEQRFPMDRRALEVFDVKLEVPRLQLQPSANRVRTELALRASERLLRSTYQGSLSLNYGLRLDSADLSLRLVDVRVEAMNLQAGSAALPAAWGRLGAVLAEQALEGQVIHRFKPEDFHGLRPGELSVTPAGLRLALLPN